MLSDERWVGLVLELAEGLDLRHSGTARHCEAVGRYAESIARELGMSETKLARVRLAGVVHDVGKASASEAILTKPGPLTHEERIEVERHPELGAKLLAGPSLADIRSWVVAHHERPDGNGYPLGLAGDEIPLEATILRGLTDSSTRRWSRRSRGCSIERRQRSSGRGRTLQRHPLAFSRRDGDLKANDAHATAGSWGASGTPIAFRRRDSGLKANSFT